MLASTAAAACSKRMKPGVLPADYLLPCLEYWLITRNHIPDFSLCLLSSNSQPYGLFWFHQTTLVPGNCADGLAMRALKGCQFLTYANQPIPNFCESQWHHASKWCQSKGGSNINLTWLKASLLLVYTPYFTSPPAPVVAEAIWCIQGQKVDIPWPTSVSGETLQWGGWYTGENQNLWGQGGRTRCNKKIRTKSWVN